jgi:DNA-binding NarL/FixJ family response regulator
MTKVMIVDDHGVLRDGLGRVITAQADMELIGMAANGEEAIDLFRATPADVVLMDLEMPVMDGIAATRAINDLRPATAILVLTSFADRRRITGALDAGAVGYLLKDASADEVVQAVRAASLGGAPLDPRAARLLLDAHAAPDPQAGLSPREREVFGLLLEGMPNKLIARQLGISEKTVKSHLTHVFRAIGVTDRVQAVLWAERQGVRGDLAR